MAVQKIPANISAATNAGEQPVEFFFLVGIHRETGVFRMLPYTTPALPIDDMDQHAAVSARSISVPPISLPAVPASVFRRTEELGDDVLDARRDLIALDVVERIGALKCPRKISAGMVRKLCIALMRECPDRADFIENAALCEAARLGRNNVSRFLGLAVKVKFLTRCGPKQRPSYSLRAEIVNRLKKK